MPGLLLVCLLLTSCHGALIDALETRHAQSCVYWRGIFQQVKGVTSTGGVPLAQCLERLGITP